jgi:hypothetical protein
MDGNSSESYSMADFEFNCVESLVSTIGVQIFIFTGISLHNMKCEEE